MGQGEIPVLLVRAVLFVRVEGVGVGSVKATGMGSLSSLFSTT